MFAPDAIDDTIKRLVDAVDVPRSHEHDASAARQQIADAEHALRRYRELLLDGQDAPTVAAWIRDAEATRRSAQARLADLIRHRSVPAVDELRAVVERLNGLPGVLAQATPEQRRRLYTALGVELRYDHRARTIKARQDASRWWG